MRLYSPKRLFQQLEAAKEEYIRANVGVRGRGQHKIILPKALELYARDAGLGAQEVVAGPRSSATIPRASGTPCTGVSRPGERAAEAAAAAWNGSPTTWRK